jgi:hypothetical protein
MMSFALTALKIALYTEPQGGGHLQLGMDARMGCPGRFRRPLVLEWNFLPDLYKHSESLEIHSQGCGRRWCRARR